jgi:hypothetical protein
MSVRIEPGTQVEVMSSFDQAWKRGFTVETTGDEGYRLRRASDGQVLPTAFSYDDVREELKRVGGWQH